MVVEVQTPLGGKKEAMNVPYDTEAIKTIKTIKTKGRGCGKTHGEV